MDSRNFLIIALHVSACFAGDLASQSITKIEDLFANSQTDFGLDLYKKAANDSDDNIFFSPLSISCALGLLHLGVKRSSLEQINSALHLHGELQLQFHSMLSQLFTSTKNSESYSLNLVNRLYGDQSFFILPKYLDEIKKYYGSQIEKVDFKNHAKDARTLINDWVTNQTNSKITDLIPSDVIKSMTKLVLVNAIYFQGQWSNQFDISSTKEDDFHLSNSKTIKVPFMRKSGLDLSYSDSKILNAEVLELPFREDFALYVVLPNQRTSLKNVEESLTSDVLRSLEFRSISVNVWLPRFKINHNFKLKDFLMMIGIKDIFDADSADLSGISVTDKLFVTDAVHKAFIKLDENGVEAAAATALVEGAPGSAPGPHEIVNFKADRPFFFYLKEVKTDIIFFLGRFNKPEID